MIKRRVSATPFVIVLLFAAGAAHARAQDAPAFSPEQVPAEGARAEDFVPRGWKVGAAAEGDLNGDRLPDRALQLVPEDYEPSVIGAAPEAHALLVLLSADGGRLRRAGLSTGLLATAVPQYSVEMSIKNRVLVINQNFGMTDVSDLTHRFRYEQAAGRFLLIGKDTWSYHRPQGTRWPSTRVSENYLTGVRLTTTERLLGDGSSRAATRRGQIPRARVFLEDVAENPDD